MQVARFGMLRQRARRATRRVRREVAKRRRRVPSPRNAGHLPSAVGAEGCDGADGDRIPAAQERWSVGVAQLCYSRVVTKELTLRQAGGSVSATLPKDMADRLHLEAGDRVLAVETDRGILLTPYAPEAERALKVAAKAAKTYRNALRELAK